ncbi:hypothetical protein JTB14_010525 [Gonioctena quinquepunctata]|nr:hypothetical protein JTB14_010525 [Gonioctena quinquepunctata]
MNETFYQEATDILELAVSRYREELETYSESESSKQGKTTPDENELRTEWNDEMETNVLSNYEDEYFVHLSNAESEDKREITQNESEDFLKTLDELKKSEKTTR